MVTNSNAPLPYEEDVQESEKLHAVQLYPQNISISNIPRTPKGHEQFAATFLASPPQKSYPSKPSSGTQALSRETELQWDPIPTATILICGHNSRDTRCGILGPLLAREFKKSVFDPALVKREDPRENARTDEIAFQQLQQSDRPPASVALISHIGGHAFAGNVVIYFPRTWRVRGGSGEVSPLAGKGVWYGRVEPRHVWGIVEETVKGGRVIGKLLRGICTPEEGGGGGG